jgi:charged multivesicular body protein 6
VQPSLKLQRDKLKQYQRRVRRSLVMSRDRYANEQQRQIQGILDREREIAKEALANGDKSRALTALRRRKYQESLLVQTDSQLETLQNLVRLPHL